MKTKKTTIITVISAIAVAFASLAFIFKKNTKKYAEIDIPDFLNSHYI